MDNVTIPTAPPATPVPVVSDPRILICLPAYGSKIDAPFADCLIRSLSSLKCIGHYQFLGGDSLVPRARNNLTAMFLEGYDFNEELNGKMEKRHILFDWLLFLDTDLTFQPGEIELLYALAVKSGPGIYGGTYPLKNLRPKVVFNPLPGSRPDEHGIVAVREVGTGFMMIHRKVFEQMQKAYPQNDFMTDGGDNGGGNVLRHDWFQVGVKRDANGFNPRYLSEDWFFCQKWIDMGGTIKMHTKICANHIGQISYPVNPKEICEVADIYREAAAREYEKQQMRLPTVAAAA